MNDLLDRRNAVVPAKVPPVSRNTEHVSGNLAIRLEI